ncbi:FAD/NAD(P)-binding domain-containing protein [Massarina eburnea CBS 473.64]|uniref:FAD/NAD(P)-binding domain-containing protein n=1 Tax=Massarina eburnea CBS 473.64 TaxID=1395130 RepID=A0A6A6SHS2_9PLEO|nr:FAD/NAD(P)-binding domain-containing protein [Massarina eburnea CBS 473.64]
MSRPPLNIVVLGGSYGGLAVAHSFLDNIIQDLTTFDGAPTYRIVLVSPSTHLYWNICAPRALVSPTLISPEQTCVPIDKAFERHPQTFSFVQGWATYIDTSAKKVHVELATPRSVKRTSHMSQASSSTRPHMTRDTSHRSHILKSKVIPYHALVIATGSSSKSPLFSLHGTHEDTLTELASFHRQLEKAQSVMVVGGGATGVETAGQLATYYNRTNDPNAVLRAYNDVFGSRKSREKRKHESNTSAPIVPRERNIERNSKRDSAMSSATTTPLTSQTTSETAAPVIPKIITLISGHPRLLPNLPAKLGKKAEKQLRGLGVHVVHDTRQIGATTNDDGTANCILNNDMTITSDVLIEATGVYPNTRFLPPDMLDANGYVVTETSTLRVHGRGVGDRVYALGDCAAYSKNCVRDVYDAVPVLVRNLGNDLLAHEVRLQTVTSPMRGSLDEERGRGREAAYSVSGLSPRARLRREDTEDLFFRAASTGLPESGPATPVPDDASFSLPSPASPSSLRRRGEALRLPRLSHSPIRTSFIWEGGLGTASPSHLQTHLQSRSRSQSHTSRSPPPLPPFPPSSTVLLTPPLPPTTIPPPPPSLPHRTLLTPAAANSTIQALQDAHFIPTPPDESSTLVPVTRYGGVGVVRGRRVPGLMVFLLKGRVWGWGVDKMGERRGKE